MFPMTPFINQFPYMDSHEMNLDWIIRTIKALNEKVDTYTILNTISYQGEWSITKQYTKWSVVFYNGLAYLSLQPVPSNVPITNTDYWLVIAPFAPEDHLDADSQNPVENRVLTAKFAEVAEAIEAETTARRSADNYIQNQVTAEVTARANADTTLQENIDAEATARENADTTLQENIDAEATARENADTTLQENIDAEATARANAIDAVELEIAKLSNYVTPEMVGTVDTEAHANDAIAAAIAYAESHNVPVCIFSNITYSSPIVLTSRNLKLYVFGTLTYTGSDFAIKCKYPRQTVYVYRLLAAYGGGIMVDTTDYSVEYLNVKMDFAECGKETFYVLTSNNHYVTYVKCWGRLWKSDTSYDCIRVEKGSEGSFIGEVAFYDIKLIGKNGIYSKGPSLSAVRAIRVSVEDISEIGFILDNAKSVDIIDARYAELQGRGSTVVKMIGAVGLKFEGNVYLRISAINDEEVDRANSNPITFYCPIANPGNAYISNGLKIMSYGKAFINPRLSNAVYAETENDIDPYNSGGFIQTIRMNINEDCVINLSEYHIAETYPYVAVNISSSHDYVVKDHLGNTLATLNGFGQYMVTLDYNHFVIKKS